MKKFLTEKYGDKFIIAPMHELPRDILEKPLISAADVRRLQDTIRAWLRQVDGYYYNTLPLNEYRRYDKKFNRQSCRSADYILLEKKVLKCYISQGFPRRN